MLAMYLLEEAGGEAGSLWVPVIVLGWFLIMTIVGWQVSRRKAAMESSPQAKEPTPPGDNPSEFDRH